jgi:23S rRNA pseudouridine2605 synthase
MSNQNEERLQKVMARAGIASRRSCEEIIAAGRVKVNGKVVTEAGTKVDPSRDQIMVDEEPLRVEEITKVENLYLALNKPTGYLSTLSDPQGRPTIMELVELPEGQRIFPVGRLDFDTEGLLLLTNDGAFANAMSHPRHNIEKEYVVLLDGIVAMRDLVRLRQGVEIVMEDPETGDDVKVKTRPAGAELIRHEGSNSRVKISLKEGKKRQVRLMAEVIGHPVLELKRVRYGTVRLGDLPSGKTRKLSRSEVANLLAAANQEPEEKPVVPVKEKEAREMRPTRSGGLSVGVRASRPGFGRGERPAARGGERDSRFGGERGERRSFGDRDNRGGERRSFGDRRSSFGGRDERGGERRSFGDRPNRFGGGEGSERGERPARSFGDRPNRSFGDRDNRGGERRSFGDRPARPGGFGNRDNRSGDGERRSFGDRPNRSFGDRPARPGGFGDRPNRFGGGEGGERSDRPARNFGDRPNRSFGDRDNRGGGERRSFGDRPPRTGNFGERGDRPARSFGDRDNRGGDRPNRGLGERRSFGDKDNRGEGRGGFGERRSFGDRDNRGGERRSFGDRPARPGGFGNRDNRGGDGERRSFGDRPNRGFGDRPNRTGGGEGSERPARNFGDRPNRSFGDRDNRGGGERRSFGGDRPNRGFGGGRPGGGRDGERSGGGGFRRSAPFGGRGGGQGERRGPGSFNRRNEGEGEGAPRERRNFSGPRPERRPRKEEE